MKKSKEPYLGLEFHSPITGKKPTIECRRVRFLQLQATNDTDGAAWEIANFIDNQIVNDFLNFENELKKLEEENRNFSDKK